MATIIVQGVEGGTLPMAAMALPEAARPVEGSADGEALYRIPVVVELPGAVLLEPPPESMLPLESYLYVIDSAGAVMAHRAEGLQIDLSEWGEALYAGGVRFRDVVELPAGRYSFRFLVTAPASRRFSVVQREVVVAAAPADASQAAQAPSDMIAAAVGPRFGGEGAKSGDAGGDADAAGSGACGRWIEAGSRNVPSALPVVPAARPVLRGGEPFRAAVFLPRDTAEAGLSGFKAEIKLSDRTLDTAEPTGTATVPLTFPGRLHELTGDMSAGMNGFEVTAELPDLTQGVYDVEVSLAAAARSWVTPSIEAWVLAADATDAEIDGGNGGCPTPWSEIVRLAAGGASSPLGPAERQETAPGAGKRGALARRVREAYRAVLGDLAATGDLAAAAERLGEVEAGFITGRLDTFARLRNAELAAAEEVVAVERESLPTLLLLHEAAYEAHFAANRFGLATHSRELVVVIAQHWAEELANEDARRLVADVLTSLAEHAASHRVAGPSQKILEQAVDLSPAHEQARLLLAVSYEKFGLLVRAREQFENLLAGNSKNVEARLRLAILLERLGEKGGSERLLRRLLRERVGGWWEPLAYQQLGRLLMRQERFGEAVATLREGREALPDEQRMALLLSYALDRSGRPGEAVMILRNLPDATRSVSARLRYGEPLTRLLRPLREQLRRSLNVRLPLLSRALLVRAEASATSATSATSVTATGASAP